MRIKKAAEIAALALVGYDTMVRPWMLRWGASSDEQQMQLPGDEIASAVPAHYKQRAEYAAAEPGSAASAAEDSHHPTRSPRSS